MPVEKGEEEDEFQILTESGVYREHHYKNEQELERLVVAHTEEVFGKSSLYFDLKQRVRTRLRAGIPDGFLLDFRKKSIPHLWVVEYELSSHDLERHVIPQLRRFVKAFDNEETITALRGSMYDEITTNNERLRRFKELVGETEEVYLTVDKALQGDATILLVYDRLPSNIEQTFEESDFHYDTHFMVFRTFEEDGRLVHLVNPLLSVETKATTTSRLVTHGGPPATLREILEVVAKMKSGKDYSEACRLVSAQNGLAVQTVRDKTTRKLGISTADFIRRYEAGTLAGLLEKKYPDAKEMIGSRFK